METEKVRFMREAMVGDHFKTEIREFILEKFPLARKQQVKDVDALLETGILDSLGVLDLVTFIEQKFSVVVTDDELSPENFQTIDNIAAFIAAKTNSKS
jgi:acyl carrier protein